MDINTTPGTRAHKVRENRLRRAAYRQGLQLAKSRRSDPNALNYGMYALIDIDTTLLVFGSTSWAGGFVLKLDDVEKYLLERK